MFVEEMNINVEEEIVEELMAEGFGDLFSIVVVGIIGRLRLLTMG